MDKGLAFLGGLGLGAAAMYFLDPDKGRRRRTLLLDQAVSAAGHLDDRFSATWKDLRQRARGWTAETYARFTEQRPSDSVLAERVRSSIGRYVSHPGSIDVTVSDGRVTLRGPILAREVDWLLDRVRSVRGVREVDNQLEPHSRAGHVPGLQGGGRRPGEPLNFLEANWSPATRFLAGVAGCGLMANCLARRTPLAALLGTAGFALFVRGLTNIEAKRLLGFGGDRRAVDVRKTITINAPVERVFPFFDYYENFPRFMAHVREVRDIGGGRTHWVVDGPAGVPMSWDAILTAFLPNQVIAWKSEPGSIIANAGIIRFEPMPRDTTRVDILLSYNPPGGALGHFAAALFGADPKARMDEDLLRLKSLIEDGMTSVPGREPVTRQEMTEAAAAQEAGAGF
jgi:uncharacterized membrane protein